MSTADVFNVIDEPLAQELEEIFRTHYSLVYRTAYSVTGNPQDAEDVVQNLFVGLLRRGCPPGPRENPKGYLYRATINLSLNAVRSRRRHINAVDESRLVAPAADFVEDNAPDPEADLQKRLVDAIAQLHPRAVEMLILRYEHNYSDAEIGKLLGRSRGVIAVTLHRARARLKKLLRTSCGEKP